MPEPPRHYARLKKLNVRPAARMHGPSLPAPLSPEEFAERSADHSAVQLVDLRSILAFGGGHVPGALNIALQNAVRQLGRLDARRSATDLPDRRGQRADPPGHAAAVSDRS
ncbi:rhodanese-like domain-containing protein [Stutzerimonas kunmingensis]|uniref:rhodanese-like domain-containing protein n=1 Tax=Stutzerimonas kunmingensis TaxID=1211807 RepID=UPI00289F3D4A|nr:rhodanese-like domain-containing protein [Stutzerimonas kunmingensis]